MPVETLIKVVDAKLQEGQVIQRPNCEEFPSIFSQVALYDQQQRLFTVSVGDDDGDIIYGVAVRRPLPDDEVINLITGFFLPNIPRGFVDKIKGDIAVVINHQRQLALSR
jgi:hypothetical protein